MPAVLAIIAQILPLIPSIEVGVEDLINWITKVRQAAQQSGEWTTDLEEAYQASLLDTRNNPAAQPDPPSAKA